MEASVGQTWHSRGGLNDLQPGERIALVIEPDRFKRAQTYALLRGRGFRTYNTGCGAVGQFIASQLSLSVIVMETALPDLDGLELIQRRRVRLPEVLIIATVCGDEDWEDGMGAHRAGADHAVRQLSEAALDAILDGRAAPGEDGAHLQ